MPVGEFRRALNAGVRVYGMERLHDISTGNLTMAAREHVAEIVGQFRAMATGEGYKQASTDADWDSLRSRFGGEA